MRVVVALGGNALLQRHQPPTAEHQLTNVRTAAAQLARLAVDHTLVLVHGNGPQVGLLALQGAAYSDLHPEVPCYPMDVLGAQTQGMVGYLLEQALGNLLGAGRQVVTLVTRVEVDAADPAFAHPTKPIGPVYDAATAAALVAQHGWTMAADGVGLRRVVPSPQPQRILGLAAIDTLLAQGSLVIAAGGGGVPVVRSTQGDVAQLAGVEAVIDKDMSAALLARLLHADVLLIATDVDAVYLHWGEPDQTELGRVTPEHLAQHQFAAGSMAPKVLAACDFVQRTGKPCHIGSLQHIEAMLQGDSGTTVSPSA
jgi:carbamate kinase